VLAEQLAEPGPEVKERRDVTIPTVGGTIGLRIYQPPADGPHPAHIYLHGGGWIVGSPWDKFTDIICRERCAGAACVVIAVDYRKAPEHKFPVGLNDCHAALTWLSDHAVELGVHPGLITVGGASAGGNLAAALTLKVRDEGGPKLALQLLEVPALDLTLSLPSHQRYGSGYALALSDAKKILRLYLTSPAQAKNPYVSPLLAPDLSGLPPAHIMSAEYDMLRDDGDQYAMRLNQSGVRATFSLQQGHVHNSAVFTKTMDSARAWRREVLTVLQHAYQ
jgi:acetyl esterase